MQAYLKDGERIKVVFQILEKKLGYTELNERKVIDISYPSLMAYVRRLRGSGRDPTDVFEVIENIDRSSGGDLYQKAEEILFDLSELTSGLARKFNRLFLKMVSVSTGEQRIKSLCVLQTLINNRIGRLGNSFYFGKKTKIKKSSDGSSAYCSQTGELTLQASEIETHYLRRTNDGEDQSVIEAPIVEDLSETLLHELSHLYHYMLRLNNVVRSGSDDLINSVRAAYIPDPVLREHLIPLLYK
ncbi:MAG: hypothetical protein LBB25_02425 [Holosporaceae bacterium]|nr:hypothetical protein [Holosporaceae bacterium]